MNSADHTIATATFAHLPDPQVCRRARLSRDARFDGAFYLGVQTTGIYCRPICPAKAPAEKNVRYFPSAALAAQAGFRPCLRCRPESAPNSPAWKGTSTTVQRALQLITQGALNAGSLVDLAERLGIGERYLRKLFELELGVSPQALASNQRLLFAKKLLVETELPVTEVAFAAGFGSVRRFNSAMQQQFQRPPSALRKRQGALSTTGHTARHTALSLTLQLHYRPPYDWHGVIGFFARHAVTGIESVTDQEYRRNIAVHGAPGSIAVSPVAGKHALRLEVQLADSRQLLQVVANVRRMFDLDANPAAIAQVLGQDQRMAPLLRQCPGVRAPGQWSLYEAAFRGIVGQQISTQAARGIIARLAASSTDTTEPLVFPRAAAIAALGDEQFPMPGRRRDTLRALCRLCAGREDALEIDALSALPGVGPWTVAMAEMRGSGQPDAFPGKDLGVEKAWARLPGPTLALSTHAANWRPWRSYATTLLWRSLNP